MLCCWKCYVALEMLCCSFINLILTASRLCSKIDMLQTEITEKQTSSARLRFYFQFVDVNNYAPS